MSNIDKKNSQIVVLQKIPAHQGLRKVNRGLLAGVFLLMTVIFIAGFLWLPDEDFLSSYKKATASKAPAAQMNPVLSAEVNTLKSQLVGLVSGSIESKLRTLEESIRSGTITHSLGTIEDLKNDVKVLRSYSDSAEKEPVTLDKEQLMQEMLHLKHLIYLSLVSCGLMLAAIAGICIKNLNRLPYKEVIRRYLGKH